MLRLNVIICICHSIDGIYVTTIWQRIGKYGSKWLNGQVDITCPRYGCNPQVWKPLRGDVKMQVAATATV